MNVWWYVARASGIVAWVILTAAVVWGILFSTRILGSKPRPAWTLDLHRWLGGLAVSFTGVHIVGLLLDDYIEFDIVDVLIPMASPWRPAAVAWGVVGLYLLVSVQATSLTMKRLPRRLWKWVHRSSFALFFVSSMHAGLAGTDTSNIVYQATASILVTAVVLLTLYRALAKTVGTHEPDARRRPAGSET